MMRYVTGKIIYVLKIVSFSSITFHLHSSIEIESHYDKTTRALVLSEKV